ncbi:MAG: ATP-grasp enzyme-like protein [Candidatus Jettenia ecosi]|uniref:ATP-grasp enzyme-like protein n=1 Tax=Candidatus Jettenia ecosi TaxID=2494326 RepID=A0A533Q7E9_9BACT|nr:MAG: ATP-grasp enzyme-like protein [Candidatus Jettenia ecosi]
MKQYKFENIDTVITYGWNRVAYNILRSLSLKGVNVAVGDASIKTMSKSSKYCKYSFSYPSFYKNPKDFIESLKSTLRILKPNVYIPVHEETFVVARYIHEFKDAGVKIPISDFQLLKSVHKKDSLCKIAESLNIPVPKTFKPKNVSDLKSIWNEIGNRGRAVIKLLNTNSSKGVFYATSYDNLLKKYTDLVEENNLKIEEYPIIQEYVNGDGYGVSVLFNNGKMRARFTHKRLREKLATGGTSTRRVSVKNPVIEEYAEYLLASLAWHGVAMVEFKYNENEKKGWLIEVNPRFWGSLALPIKAGVDFPYLLYRMAVDGDVETVTHYQEGVVVRWILGDILATLSHIKAKKSIKPIFDFFSFKGESFDDLYKDDIMPFMTECFYYLSKFVKTGSSNPTEEALLDVDKI